MAGRQRKNKSNRVRAEEENSHVEIRVFGSPARDLVAALDPLV